MNKLLTALIAGTFRCRRIAAASGGSCCRLPPRAAPAATAAPAAAPAAEKAAPVKKAKKTKKAKKKLLPKHLGRHVISLKSLK